MNQLVDTNVQNGCIHGVKVYLSNISPSLLPASLQYPLYFDPFYQCLLLLNTKTINVNWNETYCCHWVTDIHLDGFACSCSLISVRLTSGARWNERFKGAITVWPGGHVHSLRHVFCLHLGEVCPKHLADLLDGSTFRERLSNQQSEKHKMRCC